MADDDKKTDAPNPLQETVDKLTGESQKYHKRAQDAEAENATLKTRLDKIEADQTAAAAAAEKAKLEGQGKYDEALETVSKQKQDLIDAADARADAAEASLRSLLGTDALKTKLGEAGVRPEAIGQVAELLQKRVKVQFADGKNSVTVLDAEGQPAFVEGNPATIDSLVEDFTKKNLHFMPPSGDTGSGNHTGGTPGEKGLTQAALLADPDKHQEWIATFPPGEATAAFSKLPRK